MNKELINELRIANLLKVIELIEERAKKEDIEKILDHVYNSEIDGLLYNVALFPSQANANQDNRFYGGFNKSITYH